MSRPNGCTCPGTGPLTVTSELHVACPHHGLPIEQLVERSSLGTPEAKAARARTTDEQVAAVLARYDAMQRDRLRAAAAAVRARHTTCSTELGACPWPNFTENEADELAAELLQRERGGTS
jgi:hypothetical protein